MALRVGRYGASMTQKPLAEKLREILLPDDVEIDENSYSDPWSYSLACDQFEREKAISRAMIEAVAALKAQLNDTKPSKTVK